MKKHKIATRVFKLISFALLFLLSAQLIFQTLFLEKFYIYNKKTSISKEMSVLANRMTSLTENVLSKELRLFSQRFGATTGIITLSGAPLYGFDSQIAFMEVETEEGKNYKVYLAQFLENKDFIKHLQEDKEVSLMIASSARMLGEQIIYPYTIQIDNQQFESQMTQASMVQVDPAINTTFTHEIMIQDSGQTQPIRSIILSEASENAKEVELKGKIRDIYIPGEEVFGNGYRENKILEEMNLFIQKARMSSASLELGKPIVYESVDTYVGIRNIIGIVPIILNGEVNFLASLTSLEQVEEAIGIMNNYTFIVFILAFIAAVILAYWYSKKLTRPLIALKDVTTDITNLDFSKTCDVESEDEIGELACNINAMSAKLKITLEQLQEDMAFKEKLSEQRKQFIVDVSHELKTPLTVLKATCEGFKDDIYESQNKSHIYNMLSQIDAMSELIQELLTVVRLEQEELLKIEVFDLSDSVLKMRSQLKSLATDKQIQVHMELEESLVTGDRKKIETVIRNFYNNAIFYSQENENIYITITNNENKWCCSIENTGVFIGEGELEKIWEPFYRVDQSRNKALGGSGLGLYIVKKILDSHKQAYGIANTDRGVRAWFELEEAKWTN